MAGEPLANGAGVNGAGASGTVDAVALCGGPEAQGLQEEQQLGQEQRPSSAQMSQMVEQVLRQNALLLQRLG